MSEIFSSTGSGGTSQRQDGRLYHNAQAFYDDATKVAEIFEATTSESAEMPDISRVVLRGIISHAALQEVHHSELGNQVEVAMPLNQYGEDSWLIYLAANSPDRTSANPVDEIIHATAMPPTSSANLVHTGYVDTLNSEHVVQLRDLWSSTFGWSENEINNLIQNLAREATLEARERSLWFSGIEQSNKGLLAAAMAERIDMPSKFGVLTLIESTEWRSLQRGLMPSVLRHLNQQIAHSYLDADRPPLIYAECNFTSRSDRAGYRAGFRIPCRYYARQILEQNVRVDDGIRTAGLRDFTFMALPVEALEAAQ